MSIINIDKGHKDFKGIHFVCRALNKNKANETRAHILCVYVKENEFVGTNGARLHCYKTVESGISSENYDDGFYEVEKLTKSKIILVKNDRFSEDSNYPDFNDIFEGIENADEIEVFIPNDSDKFCLIDSLIPTVIRALPANRTIKYAYLEDVITNDDEFNPKVFINNPFDDQPVLIQIGAQKAIIMPVKLPD